MSENCATCECRGGPLDGKMLACDSCEVYIVTQRAEHVYVLARVEGRHIWLHKPERTRLWGIQDHIGE